MNKFKEQSISRLRAFTLIEMLVVIAIIAILAALIVPAAIDAAESQRRKRAQAELSQIETVIEAYKAARGHYPPDNDRGPLTNQLFYELTGTVYQQTSAPRVFRRIHGVETINDTTARNAFGVDGFVNSSYVTDPNNNAQLQAAEARDFFPNIKPAQYLEVDISGAKVAILGLPIEGPADFTSSDGKKINPWSYNASNPTNSPSTYDLWVDIVLKGKTNRICNWSDVPVILN